MKKIFKTNSEKIYNLFTPEGLLHFKTGPGRLGRTMAFTCDGYKIIPSEQ
ncbi:MAG: hypothetical protein JJV89_03500 [Desulfosarcina sp.]|nr:hypothetical protein [Desulfobacterales bacterium]